MAVRVRVISIGAMSAHPSWGEKGDARPAHATTTLIESGKARILVDPSLPAQALVPRLAERSGKTPKDITHVFLTSFHPMRRRDMGAFPEATVLVGAAEIAGVRAQLRERLEQARQHDDEDQRRNGSRAVAQDQQATAVKAVGHGTAQQHEGGRQQCQRGLRQPDLIRGRVQHGRDQIGENHHLHADRVKPGGGAGEVPAVLVVWPGGWLVHCPLLRVTPPIAGAEGIPKWRSTLSWCET